MGWGKMLLLGDVGQQLDIGNLEDEIAGMKGAFRRKDQIDREQGRSIEELRQENRELKLYLGALVRLLVAKGLLKSDEVESIVRAIEPET